MAQPTSDPSKAYKWVALVCSLVCLAFLAAAAIRENVTADWRRYQQAYRGILKANAADTASRRAAEAFQVQIRQVTVVSTKTIDRCVTCHTGIDDPRMADQPNPYKTHPKGLLKIHATEKYGCTICHQGQGAALTFEEAKAEDYFWDYPLIPAALTQATCNQCHDPSRLPAEAAGKLARGKKLYEEKGCAGCHKLGGKGGPQGPALDNVGLKTKHQFVRTALGGSQTTWNWLTEHFRNPGGLITGSLMPVPAVTRVENEALTIYMLSLRQQPIPSEYQAPDKIEEQYARLHPPEPDGARLYRQYCAACHDTALSTRWDKLFQRFVPAIRNPAFLRTEDDECLITNIREGRPGTRMPTWGAKAGGLSEPELEALVAYLRQGTPATALPPAPPRGSADRGRRLFYQECAGCHGPDGKGLVAPALNNPVFQSAATDAFIAQTIRLGRENTPMPAFARAGFEESDFGDLLAFVRTWAPAVVTRRQP